MKRGSSRSAPAATRWFDRWLAACEDLAELERSHPMTDAVIDEIDGRLIRIGDHWLADFASCNYLGFDLDQEIIAAIPEYLARWGTHPSWSRLLGSPVLYEQIEERLTELLGGRGHARVADDHADPHVRDPRARGRAARSSSTTAPTRRSTTAASWPRSTARASSDSVSKTWGTLSGCSDRSSGAAPDLHRRHQQHDRERRGVVGFARLAREYDARLYVDDAHGFGVIGERAADELSPFGKRGNGMIRYYDEGSGTSCSSRALEVVLVAGCVPRVPARAEAPAEDSSASFPLLGPVAGSFSCNHARRLRGRRWPRRRDPADLWKKTVDVLECLDRIGARTPDRSGFPIIEVPLARHEDIDAAGRFLFENGIYMTLATYPLVPRDEVGFRIQLTAAIRPLRSSSSRTLSAVSPAVRPAAAFRAKMRAP